MTDNTVLRVDSLWVDYYTRSGPIRVVQDVSFEIRRGEILGLAGESGSGKSTVAQAVTRLIRPTVGRMGGDVWLQDENIAQLDRKALRHIKWKKVSIVAQSAMNSLNPVLRIRSQFDDILQSHGQRNRQKNFARMCELIEMVSLSAEVLDAFPHQLSGGMKQRVAIAMALLFHPDLVIMDEPTTALDVIVEREIVSEIKRLQRQFGFSVLFISHDLDLLLRMADRVAIMYGGYLMEIGSVQEFAHPLHPYSRALLQSFPAIGAVGAERRRGIPGYPPDPANPPGGCRFHPRCSHSSERCGSDLPVWEAVEGAGDQRVRCIRWREIPNESHTGSD